MGRVNKTLASVGDVTARPNLEHKHLNICSSNLKEEICGSYTTNPNVNNLF